MTAASSTLAESPALDQLLTKKQAAMRLAISTRTLDRMVVRGLVERIYVMGSVRFRCRDIDRIIEAGA